MGYSLAQDPRRPKRFAHPSVAPPVTVAMLEHAQRLLREEVIDLETVYSHGMPGLCGSLIFMKENGVCVGDQD
jgi:hypothetical protein